MHSLFLVSFLVGLCLTAALAALSGLGGHLSHTPAHLHSGSTSTPVSAHAHAGAVSHAPGAHSELMTSGGSALSAMLGLTLSWLSPLVVVSGLLWFGAGGLIADLTLPWLSLPIALIAAVGGAALVRGLISAFIHSSATPLSAVAEGAIGELSVAVRPNAVGEVIYVLEGLHRSAPARSVDGAPLPRGTQVIIVRRERGVALVSPLDPLSGLNDGQRGGLPSQQILGDPQHTDGR